MKFTLKAMMTAAALLSFNTGQAGAQALEWTTGQLGAGWYGVASGLASEIMNESDLTLKVVPGGGKDNPLKLEAGISQFGFGIDFLAFAAMKGTEPYDHEVEKVSGVANGINQNMFHFIRANGETKSLEEALKSENLRIGVPKNGDSTELTFQRVMEFYDTSYEKIREEGGKIVQGDYSDLVSALRDGQVDYLFIALSLPGAAVIEISQAGRDAQLVDFPEELEDYLVSTYGYSKGTIPAGTYENVQDGDVSVPVMNTMLLASTDVDEDTVYEFTKALLASQPKFPGIHSSLEGFDPATAWQMELPLHPGAARAFEEAGFK
ncbi:TAXI family TRAP transporter solute-binding subunit [Alloyangia pacifica]|uniref:TRAP transporter solute receptor, TAXI family n=1 Tax=Alloyangia pacifica TaxID=311180 RepID=A0A1I6UVA8_9RHOB|nr:TAXI family TRAP transporter solute-binding subunit [Alloyangia pacifica]SDI54314.1 hypothetical protein SAMN04488245_11828 [Alloyangia pacifica]SFT05264.1 hypothetical protein SAMN04488050_10924 [Alloyangia pacifica]